MNDFLSFINDVIGDITMAFKYAELDFYKLKSEVTTIIDKAKSSGYGNPDFCSLAIKVIDSFETSVIIEAYYDKGSGKYQKFTGTLDIGMLSNIPVLAKNKLDKEGELEIKLDDFDDFNKVSEDDIIPTIDFKRLCNFYIKNAKRNPLRKELHITDEFFHYRVALTYVYENGEEEDRIKYFGYILDLPKDVADKIASDEDKSCCLDVTNNDKN